ncbi:hypothetical protein ISN45_At02g022800 [Arabidopsis thaliana x Arabidopsis arenosa]|uniref:Transmembrane protein n=1 Tax=Arabidopsis thaliana x Arabidopsis arenosa TaxID=1240361 RepID=A0A8T2FNK5_9BRAS|nr:hypothetical protein ISN45_At02g022800 [Arabidopsis thaliana x Arabidopsis arenosa]
MNEEERVGSSSSSSSSLPVSYGVDCEKYDFSSSVSSLSQPFSPEEIDHALVSTMSSSGFYRDVVVAFVSCHSSSFRLNIPLYLVTDPTSLILLSPPNTFIQPQRDGGSKTRWHRLVVVSPFPSLNISLCLSLLLSLLGFLLLH